MAVHVWSKTMNIWVEFLCKQSLCASLQTNLAFKIVSSFTDGLETQLTPVSSFTFKDTMVAQQQYFRVMNPLLCRTMEVSYKSQSGNNIMIPFVL